MEKLNVSLTDGTKVLEVRQGQALPLREPVKVRISGTIDAPRKYVEKRGADLPKQKTHVTYSREQMQIILSIDEESIFGAEIIGRLELNKDLKDFGVNAKKLFTVKDLQQFLKMSKYFFTDKDENMKIVSNLGKFKASVQTQLEEGGDTRGNKNKSLDVKVDSNIGLEFMLSLPIFKGQPSKTFKVEICFDVRDADISVWLESAELQELILKTRDEIIDNELKSFAAYVIIEQ